MAGLDFKNDGPKEEMDEKTMARNSNAGLALFSLYVLLYGGFMALSAFAPKKMAEPFMFGINLAIGYGFGLIFAALALALVYMWICRNPAK